MEGLEEVQTEEAKKGRPKKDKEPELKPVKLVNNGGSYSIELYDLPVDAEIICEQEIQGVEYSTAKKRNELTKRKIQRGYTKGFFNGIFDLNENGYSESLELTILGYK